MIDILLTTHNQPVCTELNIHGPPDDVNREHATIIFVMFHLRTNHPGDKDPPLSTSNIVGGHSPHCDVKPCCTICHCHNSAFSDNGGWHPHTNDNGMTRNFSRKLRKILPDSHERCYGTNHICTMGWKNDSMVLSSPPAFTNYYRES